MPPWRKLLTWLRNQVLDYQLRTYRTLFPQSSTLVRTMWLLSLEGYLISSKSRFVLRQIPYQSWLVYLMWVLAHNFSTRRSQPLHEKNPSSRSKRRRFKRPVARLWTQNALWLCSIHSVFNACAPGFGRSKVSSLKNCFNPRLSTDDYVGYFQRSEK